MIRETNAPRAYIHKTEFERNLNVAALHAGKPIRRIRHTNDIYPPAPPKQPKRTSRQRSTEQVTVTRINNLLRWLSDRTDATIAEMEAFVGVHLNTHRRTCARLQCSITWLVRNDYIINTVRHAKGRCARYAAAKNAIDS